MAELTEDTTRHFLVDLRRARAAALANAEAFDEVLFAVERLGAFLVGKTESLGRYRAALRSVAVRGIAMRENAVGSDRSRFDRVFDLVHTARNDALHQGAAARHLTASCVELALMMENGMSASAHRVKDLMAEHPRTAQSFESIGSIRRTLLINAFSYLPVFFDNQWRLVSDVHLVHFLRAADTVGERSRRLSTSLEAAVRSGGLGLEDPTATVRADDPLALVLGHLGPQPILVLGNGNGNGNGTGVDALRGIITPFDLL